MSKKIKRKLIKIQNNAARGGGRIPSISEAYIIYRKNQSDEQTKRK